MNIERFKENLEILNQHNLTNRPVYHLTDGKVFEKDLINAIVVNLIAPVIDFIAVVIAFFGLYILSKVALWIVFGFINLMFKRGILGVLNRALGFVFFGFLGIVVAWGVAVITELVIHVPAFADNAMLSTFEGGFVYKFFNTYNPMELLLSF